MANSQNGYPANNVNLTSSRRVPGSNRSIRVRNGPAGDLLLWFAGQFDAHVEDIDPGPLDDWGYAERPIRGGVELSNHASGTAIDLNAPRHPLGTQPSANFSASQIGEIRRLLSLTGGAIRWGGDYTGRKDPMHFEIVASEARCATVLKSLTNSPQEDDDMTPQEVRDTEIVWYNGKKSTINAIMAEVHVLYAALTGTPAFPGEQPPTVPALTGIKTNTDRIDEIETRLVGVDERLKAVHTTINEVLSRLPAASA